MRTNNPLVQTASSEDIFIDQMALGKLLVKDKDGHIVAGSLEGLIAEIIKVTISRFRISELALYSQVTSLVHY